VFGGTSTGGRAVFTLDGTTWFVGGPLGILYRSTDGAGSFSSIGDFGGAGSAAVQGIGGVSNTDIWAVNNSFSSPADIRIGHWNGATFDSLSSLGYSDGFSDVQAVASNEVYISSRSSANVLRWDGSIWNVEATGAAGVFGYGDALALVAVPGPQVTGISPSVVGSAGGDELVITGAFEANVDLEVRLGGELAYGGQGYGYLPQSSDGTTVTVIAPPLPEGFADVGILVVSEQIETVLEDALTVLKRNWPSKGFEMRKSFPRWQGVGARKLEDEV